MDSSKDKPFCWVFLSHSNLDYEHVRQRRNELEADGYKPIMFFLKCLDDAPNDEELWRLIEREIASRDWFVLCNSPNAQESKNVQREVEIIETMHGKKIDRIDVRISLNEPPNAESMATFKKRATVFLSYASEDSVSAEIIRDVLIEHDYRIFHDLASLPAARDWQQQMNAAVAEAASNGFVLVLLSDRSLTSQWMQYEVGSAIRHADRVGKNSNIIPVALSDITTMTRSMPADLLQLIGRIPIEDFSQGDLFDNTRRLIRNLKIRAME